MDKLMWIAISELAIVILLGYVALILEKRIARVERKLLVIYKILKRSRLGGMEDE